MGILRNYLKPKDKISESPKFQIGLIIETLPAESNRPEFKGSNAWMTLNKL